MTRRLFARVAGVDADCVALLQSLAEAAATVARSVLPVLRQGEIVLADREFRSNVMPWVQFASSAHSIRLVSDIDGADWTQRVVDSISSRTALVAISEVQSASGARLHVEEVAHRCRRVGAELFLNLTQSAGVLQCDLEALGADYAAAHGYKWLLAPRGAAWLYVRRDHVRRLTALAPNWKNAPHAHEQMYGVPQRLADDARRLDCSLAWPVWAGARAALQLVLSLPAAKVESHCLALAAELREELAALGWETVRISAPSHIVSALVPDAGAVALRLADANVVATAREGLLRFGCHYFNSRDDVAAVPAALTAVLSK